jgi:heavy metal sensor kinase
MFTKSIKWRLLLGMTCLLAFILTGLGVAIYEIHRAGRISRLDEELRHRTAALNTAFFSPPVPGSGLDLGRNRDPGSDPDSNPGPGQRPPAPPEEFPGGPPDSDARLWNPPAPQLSGEMAGRLLAAYATNGFYFVLWLSDEAAPGLQSAHTPAGVIRPPPDRRDIGTYPRTRGAYREMIQATGRGDCVLVGRSIAPEFAAARRFAGLLLLGGITGLALILAGAWWLVDRALQPVEKISAAALKISSGHLAQRISVAETESELGQLAAVLNATFARLETAFAQQKQFTSDAAHELRTPIAVLISEAQITLARPRSPEDYRDAIAACLETAQKMRRLTESLLELARLDEGQIILHREKADLAAIVQDGMKLTRPFADARRLQVRGDLAPVETFCDATRIAQVVTNLLTNAIHYNRDGGEIRVTTRAESRGVVLTVADTGRGISAADLPHVFERFYRADKSRPGGHAGLGLAIAKSIVTAHGGTIEVASVENAGTTFTVSLPGSAATE